MPETHCQSAGTGPCAQVFSISGLGLPTSQANPVAFPVEAWASFILGTLMMKRVVGRMRHIRPHQQTQKPLMSPLFPWLLRAGVSLVSRASPTCPLRASALNAFANCAVHRTLPFVSLYRQYLCPCFPTLFRFVSLKPKLVEVEGLVY